MTVVAITQNEAIGQAVEEALGHMPLETLVRDKLVAVKPNETWASVDDTKGVTQPDILRAVLRHLNSSGRANWWSAVAPGRPRPTRFSAWQV